jgi:hypothetical protein
MGLETKAQARSSMAPAAGRQTLYNATSAARDCAYFTRDRSPALGKSRQFRKKLKALRGNGVSI